VKTQLWSISLREKKPFEWYWSLHNFLSTLYD